MPKRNGRKKRAAWVISVEPIYKTQKKYSSHSLNDLEQRESGESDMEGQVEITALGAVPSTRDDEGLPARGKTFFPRPHSFKEGILFFWWQQKKSTLKPPGLRENINLVQKHKKMHST
jgi:hypothetical protein